MAVVWRFKRRSAFILAISSPFQCLILCQSDFLPCMMPTQKCKPHAHCSSAYGNRCVRPSPVTARAFALRTEPITTLKNSCSVQVTCTLVFLRHVRTHYAIRIALIYERHHPQSNHHHTPRTAYFCRRGLGRLGHQKTMRMRGVWGGGAPPATCQG